MEPPTTGPTRPGVRATASSSTAPLPSRSSLTSGADRENTVHRDDLTGSPPGQLLPGLRLLREFRHRTGCGSPDPSAPRPSAGTATRGHSAADPGTGLVFDIVDALATIQEHTRLGFWFPTSQS